MGILGILFSEKPIPSGSHSRRWKNTREESPCINDVPIKPSVSVQPCLNPEGYIHITLLQNHIDQENIFWVPCEEGMFFARLFHVNAKNAKNTFLHVNMDSWTGG